MAMVEKILSRGCGAADVSPGTSVVVDIDLVFGHEGSGPRRWQPILDELSCDVWDPAKVAVVVDHYTPATAVKSAEFIQQAKVFAERHRLAHFLDSVGISHIVLAERGVLRPGMIVAGGDSHTTMGGAFGTYSAGYGLTDMGAMVATGKTWVQVPHTLRIECDGAFGQGVTAKDLMLRLCRDLGMENTFCVAEFAGSTIDNLSMWERMVLCNMAAELGCDSGIVAPDAVTFDFLRQVGAPIEDEDQAASLASDIDAEFIQTHRVEVAALAPQIAAPHSPQNSGDAADYSGQEIDQAYIGACVGAKLDDLHSVAKVLRGRQVAKGVKLLIAPASTAITHEATRDGTLDILLSAGAILLPTGCGACAGLGAGVLAPGQRCISSTNRNFQGRMGSSEAEVYLGSPYSVAAAAVAGRIVDPREMLEG
ncbi:aconitase/3-isopropylmalate dehydratase large subunit family protein [Altererythrobacter sp. GH1-8]|uniref:3-isopropylmalate dehydratase large subunit n=1 Tax=Altererythrobacter sp. GH1-8 TaxID=3349333 RepID=UPI00374D90F2